MEFHRDVAYGVRLLRRAPLFSAVALATLALGIGGSTVIFTVVNAVLLRPLRFPDAERLAFVTPSSRARLSAEYFAEWRQQNRTFSGLAAWHDARVNLTGRGEPLEVRADRVTTNFFALLGTPPLVGRTFTVGSNLANAEPEVVLGHGLWQRRFGEDPDIVGQAITIDGERLSVVGVMPAGFTVRTTELSESLAEIWLPLRLTPGSPHGMGGFLHVVGRLSPGVAFDAARADLARIAQQIEAANPSYSSDWTIGVVPLRDATVEEVRPALFVLLGGVAFVLTIACVNVANLVLGRTILRLPEISVRRSLGATTGRLARQFLAEHLALTGIGALLGVLLAAWGTQALVGALPAGMDLPRKGEIGIDLRVLAFAALITAVATLLFGVLPLATSSGARQPAANIRLGSSARSGGQLVGGALIVSEVALAVALLAGAGLLLRSYGELTSVDPGFEPQRVLTMRTTLGADRYDSLDRVRAFADAWLERVEALPDVAAAGFVNYLPMSRFGSAARFEIEGRPETGVDDQKFAWVSVVGGRYFEAMEISLVRGRLPGTGDRADAQPVFVIDEELARRYWPDSDPIGARLIWPDASGDTASLPAGSEPRIGEIVGVVASVRWRGMASDPAATVYSWFPQQPVRELTLVARAAGDPLSLAGVLTSQVRELDSSQPVADVRLMDDLVSADVAQPRVTMLVISLFAGAALFLAALGLYGVIAFAVTRRTREIGLRVALGAMRSDVIRLVVQRGLLLTCTGLAIGIVLAIAAGRAAESLLYGIAPTDPVTLAVASLFLLAVSAAAAYLPARRAARIDPALALRAE